MKIYTKAGDDGTTGLLGPGRHRKDAPRIEAYGTVDELNASLGVARAQADAESRLGKFLDVIQQDLFSVGAALADPDPDGRFHRALKSSHVDRLEREIDALESSLSPLTQFIVPGGVPLAASLHHGRTVCRRAERRVVTLADLPDENVPADLIAYLNRLSDLLFVMARAANREAGRGDVAWEGPAS